MEAASASAEEEWLVEAVDTAKAAAVAAVTAAALDIALAVVVAGEGSWRRVEGQSETWGPAEVLDGSRQALRKRDTVAGEHERQEEGMLGG